MDGESASVFAVPAMSRWAQGKPSTNSRRNQPAVIDPPDLPPEFFTSAMDDLIWLRYSSHNGSGQHRSPASTAARRTSSINWSSFPMSPVAW